MGFGNFMKGLPVFGGFFEDDNPEEKMLDEQRKIREAAKAKQYEYLGQMKGPQVAEATRRRIAALEDDAKARPLVEDKYFQGQRAAAVQGGQQALSGIQNKQKAAGVSGGFSNVGSTQDAYDRLSGQLANIGAQAGERRAAAGEDAANMQQGIEDQNIDFWNNQLKAKMGIESGDFNSAMDGLNQYYGSKQKQADRNSNTRGQYASGLLSAFGPGWVKKKAPAKGDPNDPGYGWGGGY